MKSAKSRILGLTTASLAAAAVMVGTPNTAEAIPLFHGGNNLIGAAVGLDENYGNTRYLAPAGGSVDVAAGSYTMPNGVTNPGGGGGTPGMTESLRTVGGVPVGLNLPQPALLSGLAGIDSRGTVGNPLLGGLAAWGARAGALTRWDTNNQDPAMGADPKLLAPPLGNVTAQIFNLTPQTAIAASGVPLDDGLAPGSVAGDGIPDFLPFTGGGTQPLVVAYTLTFIDENDTDLDWNGDNVIDELDVVPEELIPRKRDYENGETAQVGSPPLVEEFFGHDGGNDLSGVGDAPGANPAITTPTTDEIDDFVDGTLFLGGRLVDAFVNLTWTEVDGNGPAPGFVPTGNFELDIQFFSGVVYDEGSLVDNMIVKAGSTGDVNFQWDDIPFGSFAAADAGPNMIVTGGLDVNGFVDYDFINSTSASQTFTTDLGVPEPLTTSLSLMGLAGLGASLRRRRA